MIHRPTLIVATASAILFGISLLRVAYIDDLWREFLVSFFHVLICAVVVVLLLRPRQKLEKLRK